MRNIYSVVATIKLEKTCYEKVRERCPKFFYEQKIIKYVKSIISALQRT